MAYLTPEVIKENDIDPYSAIIELKGSMYRTVGWDDNGDLICRVLEVIN